MVRPNRDRELNESRCHEIQNRLILFAVALLGSLRFVSNKR
jgi:hypothetical protein